MKILVVGLGSMGKRRIRLIKEAAPEAALIGVDGRADRREEASGLGLACYETLQEAFDREQDIECAFISTSPLSHAGLIESCLKQGLHVFTELNLTADGYQENMKLAEKAGKVLFLSSTFLYRREIEYIQKRVHDYGSPVNYTYHVGQYLPDWHPWENYRQFFVGDKRTNGCREILAIEMPWIIRTFGEITQVLAFRDRRSDLQIDYDDSYQIMIRHRNGSRGVFCVDVVSPKAVRNLEIMAEHFYLSWDGKPTGIEIFEDGHTEAVKVYQHARHQSGYQPTIVEDAYLTEIEEFFKTVNGEISPRYGFADDLETLRWIDRIEEV